MNTIFIKLFQLAVRVCPFIILIWSLNVLFFHTEQCYSVVGQLIDQPQKCYFVSTTGKNCVRYSFTYKIPEEPSVLWKVENNNNNQKYTYSLPYSSSDKIIINGLENKVLLEENEKSIFIFLICIFCILHICLITPMLESFISRGESSPYLWTYRFYQKGHKFGNVKSNFMRTFGCNN